MGIGGGTQSCGWDAGAGYGRGELGELLGGVDYPAVGQVVSRFSKRLQTQRELRREVTETQD